MRKIPMMGSLSTLVVLVPVAAALAGLLGVVPGFPIMSFEGGATTAGISNGSFTVSASPARMLMSPTGPLVLISSPSSLDIGLTVNTATCDLVGGVPGYDLEVTGTADLGGGDIRTGTLLTGEILELGIGTPSGTIEIFDLRFQVTGGSLSDFYTNEDAGITLNIENSVFTGDCSDTFQGKPKGQLGPIPPVQAAAGCTPGYWKQKHHFDSWEATAYDPNQTVFSVFGALDPSVDGLALKDALKLGGGGLKALMRHAVAALLNASHPDVNASVTDVIVATQAAFANQDYEPTKNLFEASNEEGCPLN